MSSLFKSVTQTTVPNSYFLLQFLLLIFSDQKKRFLILPPNFEFLASVCLHFSIFRTLANRHFINHNRCNPYTPTNILTMDINRIICLFSFDFYQPQNIYTIYMSLWICRHLGYALNISTAILSCLLQGILNRALYWIHGSILFLFHAKRLGTYVPWLH